MNKPERWERGLDQAHDLLLEAREQEIHADEFIRDWILEDESLFQRLAQKWLDDPLQREAFLDWGIEECKRERTPQFTRGWARDPLQGAAMKPCPFCGKADKEMVIIQEPPMGGYGDETVVYAVRCEWCGCRGPEGSGDGKAIVAWEERPLNPKPEEESHGI